MDSKTEDVFASTMAVLNEINAVEGFDPRMVTACYRSEDGESNMYLQAEPAMLWFRMKYPKGRLEQNVVRITDASATIEGKVFDDDGVLLANAFATRYYSNTDQYGKDYIQNAGVSAIRKALGICGFGTPRDAEYIEGVTVVYEIGKAPEQPVDTGRALNRLPVPPTPKISTTGRQSGTERTESPDNPQNEPASEVQTQKTHAGKRNAAAKAEVKKPTSPTDYSMPQSTADAVQMPVPPVAPRSITQPFPSTPPVQVSDMPNNLDEALGFVIPNGRYAGKTMKDLLDAGEKDGIRFFLKPSYTGKPIQSAARMIAGQYSL